MSFRKASLAALSVTLVMGAVFFILSFQLPMRMPGMVIGAGYYPRVLSALLIVSSAAGIVTSWRRKENASNIVEIPNPKFFFLVLGLAVLTALVWMLTHRFYPVCCVVVLVMLWFLNPQPSSKSKAIKTVVTAAILLGAVYTMFTLILQLNL